MKKFTVILALLACAVSLTASGDDNGVTTNQTTVTSRQPNSGPVDNAETALQIGKVILSSLLTPEDFQKKVTSKATLKDGIWTVSYSELLLRINSPVVIQIRQQTGAILSYRDPNV